ncbi:MAG: SGNH/GDSL hydrolase family protein [Erysipelotrichaceae bacterium]|nr:SGNH/GDSL hydrolase family protein [Erysipelotrichaceae bacterium]
MKILFIGNSHTFVHYVPLRVKTFLENNGVEAQVTMLTHPGVGLDWHLQQSQTYFNLLYGDYDAVVLQHNAHPFPGKESLVSAGVKMASLTPENTRVYLYMTWSEKNNPEGQKVMSEAYEELAKETGAGICPVGKIWWQIKEKYPDELYFADGEHSSVFGASLSASVIASTLIDKEMDIDTYYQEAKKLEETSYDQRLIDLVLKDGEFALI